MVFCLVATEILICETSRRDDKTSSCNHDIDLVIGIALVLYWVLVGLMSSCENKHKGLRNKGNVLRSGDWTVSNCECRGLY